MTQYGRQGQNSGGSVSASTYLSKKKMKDNDAMGLEKFMARAGPVMEQVIEENSKLRLALDKEKSGAKPPKVEQKQSLHFPNEILFMLGTPDE